jgi:hypothetical protein
MHYNQGWCHNIFSGHDKDIALWLDKIMFSRTQRHLPNTIREWWILAIESMQPSAGGFLLIILPMISPAAVYWKSILVYTCLLKWKSDIFPRILLVNEDNMKDKIEVYIIAMCVMGLIGESLKVEASLVSLFISRSSIAGTVVCFEDLSIMKHEDLCQAHPQTGWKLFPSYSFTQL